MRDGLLNRRLVGEHRLEAPGEGRVLLDVLLILGQRGRADAAKFAARERGLQHVRGVHRAFGGARAHHGVQLVDEENDLAVGFGDRLEDGLEAILELTAILGARDQRAHVEGHHLAAAERLRNIARDDALGQTFDDGGLADAGLADENRIVLGSTREDLNHAAHFVRATDDRIELALESRVGEVA